MDDFVPDAQDCVLPFGAKPQVPVVEEKIDPVLFGGDRKFFRDLKDLHVGYGELVPTRRAHIFADCPREARSSSRE